MTRDEARKIVTDNWAGVQDAFGFVLALESLGLLKLDEPKKLPQRLRDFVMDARLAQGDAMERLAKLGDVLHDYGLQISEKGQ